jgi:hypothetical protein
MTDLEQRLRDLLREQVREAPAAHDTGATLRRTRRRQVVTVLSATIGTVAAVALLAIGVSAVLDREAGVPATQPTTSRSLNGITITYPEGWFLIDPDAAGLNGRADQALGPRDLPRLVLALSPQPPSDLLACPGQVEGEAPTFLMTVQERPPTLPGDLTPSWPVELGSMDAAAAESGCYPGWTFLDARWLAEGRAFEAVLGLAPDVSDADRDAVLAAFGSMTFAPSDGAPTSVVLATGTAAGEDWELIVTRQDDGLSLSLQGASFGTGTGGYDPASGELRLTSHVFGEGSTSARVIFAAVPADVVLLVGVGPDFVVYPEVLDVPKDIDRRLNAFVVVIDAETDVAFEGFTATDELIVAGGLDAEGRPLPEPPEPDEVLFDGRTNDCWWSLTRTSEDQAERVQLVSPLGDVLTELLVDVRSGAPPIQLASYTCPLERGGTLVFGVVTEEVADLRWPSSPVEGYGLPECWPGDFPPGFCYFLLDGVGDAGEAIALDADGNEIGRASYG